MATPRLNLSCTEPQLELWDRAAQNDDRDTTDYVKRVIDIVASRNLGVSDLRLILDNLKSKQLTLDFGDFNIKDGKQK